MKWTVRSALYRLKLWTALEQARLLLRYFAKSPHEPQFAALPILPLGPGPILDIGANIGQSAVSFRMYDSEREIISFEPNFSHKPDLHFLSLWLPRFSYQILGLSSENSSKTFRIPYVSGVPLSQEGSFDPTILNDPQTLVRVEHTTGQRSMEIREKVLPCKTVDQLNLRPALIKIDVQGHETPVLEGARRTLETHPVIMVENGDNLDQITAFLAPLGYRVFQFNENSRSLEPARPKDEYQLNYFFIHSS